MGRDDDEVLAKFSISLLVNINKDAFLRFTLDLRISDML